MTEPVSLCEHLELTEKVQKVPTPGYAPINYGRGVYFRGKTVKFLGIWNYCPICGHRVRSKVIYSKVPEGWGDLKDSKVCKHEQGWISQHTGGKIWHCSDCGVVRYEGYE